MTIRTRMKKAGVDSGLTHVKAFWINDRGEEVFRSTADMGPDELALEMQQAGITDLCVAGNGSQKLFNGFKHHCLEGNPLKLEISTQATGVSRLLSRRSQGLPEMYYLISIGTGTSYTLCDNRTRRFVSLIGSAIGAGTVDGLMALAEVKSGPLVDTLLSWKLAKGDLSSFDLMLGEAIPSLKGTPLERYAASHLAKVPLHFPGSVPLEITSLCMSAVNMLVTDVARSILLHDKNPVCRIVLDEVPVPIRDVVILGTMPHRSTAVRLLLDTALRSIHKDPIFPEHGEYALAVGAYHRINP